MQNFRRIAMLRKVRYAQNRVRTGEETFVGIVELLAEMAAYLESEAVPAKPEDDDDVPF